MGCMFLFTEDRPDVSIPALEYAGFGSVPYRYTMFFSIAHINLIVAKAIGQL
jgi:hypothetical protein